MTVDTKSIHVAANLAAAAERTGVLEEQVWDFVLFFSRVIVFGIPGINCLVVFNQVHRSAARCDVFKEY